MHLFLERRKHMQDIGAVASSSRFLAHTVVDLADLSHCGAIAEIGPGTGVFTKKIAEHLGSDQSFFTIEKDDLFYAHLKKRYPEIPHYNMCASAIRACMDEQDIDALDCIISSLPWAIFDDALQDKLMSALYESLRPGGIMLTFTYIQSRYLSKGIACKAKLEKYFSSVEESDIIRLNIPPAFVYICRK